MRGITKYTHTWRACWSERGVNKVEYFPSEAEAIAHYKKMTKGGNRNVAKYHKRSNAKDKSLPIGISDVTSRRDGGKRVSYSLATLVIIEGKQHGFSRVYGACRTREEALELVLEKRAELLQLKAEKEGKSWLK